MSFRSQLDQVKKLTSIEPNITNTNSIIDLINGSHKMNDLELISKLNAIINNFYSDQPFLTIQMIYETLKLNFKIVIVILFSLFSFFFYLNHL